MPTIEQAYASRLSEVLASMAELWPSLSVTVDLWRPITTDAGDTYVDTQSEKWVRLGEGIPAFLVEDQDRWFEKEVGIIRQNSHYLLMNAGYGLDSDDHVIVNGEPWMITEAAEQAGVAKIKIDRRKSRFVMPDRTLPTHRMLRIKARIS